MTPQPALAAECDWTGAYINRETRKIDPLPPLAMEIWDRKVGELGAALPDPDAAPRRKGFSPAAPSEDHGRRTLEGQIEAGWIDRMGHMGIEHYALIFERASRKYLESLGFDLARERERGLGAFVLSTRVKYLKELKLGEAFEVRTRMAGTGRKSVTYRHELLRADAPPGKDPTLTESLCAVCDQTTAFVDLSTRRAIELPMKLMGDQIGK
ncbi:acyl-CoA thioesterase [Candidatus Sumerlaeota bacterium]|nr:acyl-CoA thioesterase [Candidatus Sumerlaeota bacterium]